MTRLAVFKAPDSDEPVMTQVDCANCHAQYHILPVVEGTVKMYCTDCSSRSAAIVRIIRDAHQYPIGYTVSPPKLVLTCSSWDVE